MRVAALVLLLPLAGCGPSETSRPTVTWGAPESRSSCVYDAAAQSVDATLRVDGEADPAAELTITVTAYADEDTSDPVGSGERTVAVDGAVHETVHVTFGVDRPPHLDEDGVTACSLTVAD